MPPEIIAQFVAASHTIANKKNNLNIANIDIYYNKMVKYYKRKLQENRRILLEKKNSKRNKRVKLQETARGE